MRRVLCAQQYDEHVIRNPNIRCDQKWCCLDTNSIEQVGSVQNRMKWTNVYKRELMNSINWAYVECSASLAMRTHFRKRKPKTERNHIQTNQHLKWVNFHFSWIVYICMRLLDFNASQYLDGKSMRTHKSDWIALSKYFFFMFQAIFFSISDATSKLSRGIFQLMKGKEKRKKKKRATIIYEQRTKGICEVCHHVAEKNSHIKRLQISLNRMFGTHVPHPILFKWLGLKFN